MNIIDSLVVTLGLDPSGFLKGQKDAEAAQGKLGAESVEAAKKVESANARAGESVAALGRKFLGLYVLLTAGKGVKEFVSDITAADAALGRTARNLDMSGRNLSAWQNAATVAGGSADGITGTLKGLTSEMQRAALTGQSSIIPVFRALGINLADAGGKARDAGAVLVDLNRKAQGMDPARFTALAHMAGIDDGTIALLEKSTAEFDRLRVEQQKYAATAEDIDAAQKRQSGFRQLLITSASLGRTILTNLTPAITTAMSAVQRWSDANQDWIKTKVVEYAERFGAWFKSVDWDKIGSDFATIAGNVRDIAGALAAAAGGVNGSSTLFKAFEAFGAMLATSVLLRLTGISSALSLLGGTALPGWIGRMIGMGPAGLVVGGTLAVGAALASGDPNKALLSGGRPDLQPQDNDLGLPGIDDRKSNLDDVKAKGEGFWGWVKDAAKKAGFGDRLHDDPKTKENIDDTAKATKGIWETLKTSVSSAFGMGGAFGGVSTSSGGIGGSGHHADGSGAGASLRDRQFHGKGNFGEKGWWTPERQGHAIDVLMKQGGLTEDGAKALVSRWRFVESAGGPTAVNPKSGAQGIAQWLGTRKGDGSSGSFDEQLGKVARELNGKEGRAKALLNTPGMEANGASAYERAEGWNARTNTDNFTARVREGMKHIVRGVNSVAQSGTSEKSPSPSSQSSPSENDYIAALRRTNDGWKLKPATQARLDQDKADQAMMDAYTKTHPDAWKLADKALGKTGMGLTHVEPGPEVRGRARTLVEQTAPTVGHAIRHALGAVAQANAVTRHDDKPIPVTYVDRNGVAPSGNPLADLHKWRYDFNAKNKHAAMLDRMTRMAASGGSTVHHTVNHMDTRIGEMSVHPKGDGKQFAGEFHGMVSDRSRRGDVVQANGALA